MGGRGGRTQSGAPCASFSNYTPRPRKTRSRICPGNRTPFRVSVPGSAHKPGPRTRAPFAGRDEQPVRKDSGKSPRPPSENTRSGSAAIDQQAEPQQPERRHRRAIQAAAPKRLGPAFHPQEHSPTCICPGNRTALRCTLCTHGRPTPHTRQTCPPQVSEHPSECSDECAHEGRRWVRSSLRSRVCGRYPSATRSAAVVPRFCERCSDPLETGCPRWRWCGHVTWMRMESAACDPI